MALATDFPHLRSHASDPTGSDCALAKDPPTPIPQLPPSPPVTDIETDTDLRSSSSPFSPSASFQQEPDVMAPLPEPAIDTDESNPQDSEHHILEPSMRLDATTSEEPDATIVSSDTNGNQQSSTRSPVTSPPYWTVQNSRVHSFDHGRTPPNASATSLVPAGLGITLQDNENSSVDDRGGACWAKSVELTDYVTVNGSTTNIGAFVVWNIRVETLNGSYMNIRKRYSEFDDFRWRLMQTFPGFEAAVPELPPKSLFSQFRPKFLEKRRAGLQYFLNCIMLNPEFSGSPVLREFLFS
ncbi:Phox-like protein [Xylaria nigripes]|nr:Phox-like protein [Xylaria nigripes]